MRQGARKRRRGEREGFRGGVGGPRIRSEDVADIVKGKARIGAGWGEDCAIADTVAGVGLLAGIRERT